MGKRPSIAELSHYLNEQAVLFLEAKSRDEAIEHLVDALERAGKLSDKKTFHEAIIKREQIVSTGIGMGVAIPHAKLEGFDDFFIAIGIQRGHEGIAWDALDGSSVRLIFMIGGPSNRQTDYLKILSRLTIAIKDETRRESLAQCHSAQQVIALFEGC